ncbi:unnamed protein product [Linum trigynum]|uniref:Uncharacterized protein n=1 Tax=Linum trigynum TaxID=586398 RepID=A0AAV2CP87_9ROSI
MCYCSSSSSSQSRSPLLPQHHNDKSTSAVVDPTTTNDSPPPPPSTVPEDNQPAAVDPNNKIESEVHSCLPHWEVVLFLFLIGLVCIGVPIMVSNNTNNSNSSGLTTGSAAGRLLTANWVIVLHLDNNVGDCCPSLHLYRIQASLFHADDGHRPLATTRRFTTLNIDNAAHDGSDVTFSIQLRAEGGVDVAKLHVVDAISQDYGTEPTLRFKSVILVWARLQPNLFPARYYLARISCNPFWIGSSNIGMSTISSDHKKCHVHV